MYFDVEMRIAFLFKITLCSFVEANPAGQLLTHIFSLHLPEWVVFEIANCRKGIWRSALVVNQAFTNKKIANLGYISLTGYYLQVCENERTAVYLMIRTVHDTHGGVRGQGKLFNFHSYSNVHKIFICPFEREQRQRRLWPKGHSRIRHRFWLL